MYVVKRDGRQEAVHFDKITARLKKLSYGLSQDHCDPVLVAQKVCAGVYKGVTTSQLDELAAETAAAMTASHPDYAQVVGISFFVESSKYFSKCCDFMKIGLREYAEMMLLWSIEQIVSPTN
jgi:ATP cone domain